MTVHRQHAEITYLNANLPLPVSSFCNSIVLSVHNYNSSTNGMKRESDETSLGKLVSCIFYEVNAYKKNISKIGLSQSSRIQGSNWKSSPGYHKCLISLLVIQNTWLISSFLHFPYPFFCLAWSQFHVLPLRIKHVS